MRIDSDWMHDHFTASSRDRTPVPARHAVQLLFAPVSRDPEVTRRCASVLSDSELDRADRFATHSEEVLFKQRRVFRRFCAALAIGTSLSLSQIDFENTESGRPYLSGLPSFWFSFSSCRFGFLGAWSSSHAVGVDLEDQTRRVEVVELTQQFFAAAEASAVEASHGMAGRNKFFRFWCLKEAALKSIGRGLPFGLDAFEFELDPMPHVVDAPPDHGGEEKYAAYMIDGADGCAALVVRDRD